MTNLQSVFVAFIIHRARGFVDKNPPEEKSSGGIVHHFLFFFRIVGALSKSKAGLPRWAALLCSIVAVIAEKVLKSGKMGIALDGVIWYYEGATQTE